MNTSPVAYFLTLSGVMRRDLATKVDEDVEELGYELVPLIEFLFGRVTVEGTHVLVFAALGNCDVYANPLEEGLWPRARWR